jgi:hypothetical protein
LALLLIDELQCLYDKDPSKHDTLFGYMKRLKQGERGLRLRIVASAVFGNAPSQDLASSALSPRSVAMMATPFEYSAEQMVSLHPPLEQKDCDEPFLALGSSEFFELWDMFWEASVHSASDSFLDNITKDAIFFLSAGQASYLIACLRAFILLA